MLNNWLGGSSLPALEQVTIFAEKRHLLLAGNVANLDTPDYQSRDLSVDDFNAALKKAIAAKGEVVRPGETPPEITAQAAMQKVRDVNRQILYHDGSDVSLEEQVTEISKNQTMHNMAVALMRSQFQNLQVAIRESVAV